MSDVYSTEAKTNAISVRPTPPQAGVERAELGAPYQPPADQPALPSAAAPTAAPAARQELGAPYMPPEPDIPAGRDVRSPEAISRGIMKSLTFGFDEPIAGLAEASGMPSATMKIGDTQAPDMNPVRPIVGAVKLLHSWLSDHPDPKVVEAYKRGRDSYRHDNKAAEDQNFWPYLLGQLGGAIAMPFGAARGVTAGGRAAYMAGSGAVTGGLNEAGEETSRGSSIADTLKGAGKGVAIGGALGGAAAGIAHGVGTAGRRISEVARGARDPEAEAGRRVAGALGEDMASKPPVDSLALKMGQEANTPKVIADLGAGETHSLARRAADTSGTAHHKLNEFVNDRFHDQNNRFSTWLRGRIGGNSAASVADDLKAGSKASNKPLYKRAYAVGSGGVWSPELENLASAPAVQDAIKAAVQRGRNRAVAEGFGGYAEKVKVNPDGSVTLGNGNIPNLQFWDYVQRELRDTASKAFRAGANEEGDAARQLHRQLIGELDVRVPEFATARGNAARFFKANDALEAGQNFLLDAHVDQKAAAKVIAGMNREDRELFRIGFMSDMADRISNTSNSVNMITAAFNTSPSAKLKIITALGPKEAQEFEALLRIEGLVDKVRPWLGGSQTSRNVGHALATGSAIGLVEAAKEGDFSPKSILFGMAATHGLKKLSHGIDARVADRVAEMLLSSDPAILKKGVALVASQPKMMDMLRRASSASARVTEQDVGPDRAAAAAATGAVNVLKAGGAHHDEHHHDPLASQIEANQ